MRIDASYTQLARVYDDMVVDPCYEGWARFIHSRWRDDPMPVRSVLDVGCGTGLLAAELLGLGYDVTGVDASPAMLERARRRLGAQAKLELTELPGLGVDDTFDAAVSTFDVLNYLTPIDLTATFTSIAERLRPRGWLIFDLHTDAMMTFALSNPVVSGESDGRAFEIHNDVDRRGRTVSTRITVSPADGADAFQEVHRQHFFAEATVRQALTAAGFEIVSITDEYTDSPVGPGSLRGTWVTRLVA